MPLYEYQCDACGHRFEMIQKFSDPPLETCPKCGGTVHKLMSSPAIQFKGSGLYITDYAKKDAAVGDGRAKSEAASKDDREERGEGRRRREDREDRRVRQEPRREDRRPEEPKLDQSSSSRRRRRPSPAERPRLRAGSSASPTGACRSSDVEVGRELARRDPAAAARSTPPPSGIPACCRCRGGRR